MTCQEFADIQKKDFFASTRAERVAAKHHFNTCPECKAELIKKVCKPGQTVEEYLHEHPVELTITRLVAAGDNQDSELGGRP